MDVNGFEAGSVVERRSSDRIRKLNSVCPVKYVEKSPEKMKKTPVKRRKVEKSKVQCEVVENKGAEPEDAITVMDADVDKAGDKMEEYVEEKKKKTPVKRRKLEKSKVKFEVVENKVAETGDQIKVTVEDADVARNGDRMEDAVENGVVEVAGNGVEAGERSVYKMVTDTIRAFNQHYLHFVQEEEKRCGKAEEGDNQTAKAQKKKKGDMPKDNTKTSSRRPDLKALTKMLETGSTLYRNRGFGSIPGIDVGHQFFSRAEMVAVGLHTHWLNGIAYIGQSGSKLPQFKMYKLPITLAIVLSGQYEDDLDNCEDIIYTGQGGNDLLGGKHQIHDQVMERGNLGLKNSMEQELPVRVIRGHQSKNSYVGKVYTYDGLYKVTRYWAEKGVSGYTVYKFRLKRIDGQPILTTAQVQFSRGQIPKTISEIRGLVCEDISGGQENIPIPATNLVDDPPVAPVGLTYHIKIKVPKSIKVPSNAPGCDCEGPCVDPRRCSCAQLNGKDFPYVHRDGGRLIEPKSVVFECGPSCGCGPECVNRTSQRGLRYRLEVFRTPKKGWAVRSWDFIPSGAPVCEYIGVLRRTDDVDLDLENNYIFDIDCMQTMKGLDGRESRVGCVSLPAHMEKDVDKEKGPEYCLDAGTSGNVARYINHSCQPNLFVQCVLSTHHDMKLARVVLFAADNIPPLKELSYDYGYVLDSVVGPDGTVKQLQCYCGAADCRKRML